MLSRKAIVMLCCVVCCMLTTAPFLVEPADSYECRVIRIYGEATQAGKIHLEPKIITVSKGTCVVWLNWSKEQEVSVTFEESQKCHDVTEAPVMFTLDTENCYVSSWIPRGGTSSLLFTEAGEFHFIVKDRDGSTTKGRIFVEK